MKKRYTEEQIIKAIKDHEAGFNIDSPVTVRVMRGCLVLTTE